MSSRLDLPYRRSIRLQGYDYAQAGAYFVTICTYGKQCVLGEIVETQMALNTLGCIVDDCWRWLEQQHPYVQLDAWVVMPNHLHRILLITADGDLSASRASTGGSRTARTTAGPPDVTNPSVHKRKSLGRLVGAFKTVSTKQINRLLNSSRERFWQRNFYERIIRNEDELNHVRYYIEHNPERWAEDEENPTRPFRR
jgi:REP element-mobilizing transposase RayT